MMILQLPAPSLRIDVEPLRQSAFSQYGTVIEDPACSTFSFEERDISPELQAVTANQGTALKYSNVSQLVDLYRHAPSQRKAVPVMNLFVCRPRHLQVPESHHLNFGVCPKATESLFDVKILERHPFTTQTFIPMGLCSADQTSRYLVIVAPTVVGSTPVVALPPESESLEIGSPSRSMQSEQREVALRPGMPDLHNIRAFLADGSQAITYGAGTWHAPMAVIGERDITFVVYQSANGISEEDCQEVELQPVNATGVCVTVSRMVNRGIKALRI